MLRVSLLQITLRPTKGLGMDFEDPFWVVKKAVIKYTCPAQTLKTRSIFRIDIQVYVEAEEEVTKHKNTCVDQLLTIKVLLIHVLLQIHIARDCV